MLIKRIMAVLLTVVMLLGSFTILVQAESSESEVTSKYTYNTNKNTPTIDYMSGEYETEDGEKIIVDTEEEKLATMDLRVESNGYRIYVDEYSGEVAFECIATGERIFTNPVNASALSKEDDTKEELLSQIIIEYEDTSRNNQPNTYNSYNRAVDVGTKENKLPSQITVKPIKNGIRVDYSIGRVDSRYLVPEIISKDDFENKILNVAVEAGCTFVEKMQLETFYKLYDLNLEAAQKSPTVREQWLKKYPVIEKTPIYVFQSSKELTNEYRAIEKIIKAYCPNFTYEELDEIHMSFDHESEQTVEALFNIAIEYKIEETYQGSGQFALSVRVPANGIRFDESVFVLKSIQILPYMGANINPESGYVFFPDGTGTLFDSAELSQKKSDTYFYGKLYGDDFAYYNLGSGAPHNEVVRYPVYGVIDEKANADGTTRDTGFFAIMEEGDAMTRLIAYYNYNVDYGTVRMEVNPRPSDTYSLSDAISVSGLSTWTVVSARKYTGDFKIKYILLTDDKVAEENNISKHYTPDYMGMAEAYRDYLEGTGILTRLTEEDVKEDIPLYIETFGCAVTTKKFLSIPYTTEVPLTSFADVRKMSAQLAENGINNVNFIMTGYTEGGLKGEKIPYKLNWDNSVEKEIEFDELIADAKEKGYGVYPDFDFVFCSNNSLFDALVLDKHAIKTIDDRYTSKREYSATRQTFINYFELAMSPAYFDHFYTELTENYLEYDPIGISVASLGSYLSSDFDEDEPYNREDSKQFTTEAFEYLDAHYDKVLTSGGNAYSWKYVDYITDAATDSSRHARSCATVPFLGIVLHGYVEFAGSAINMEGNIDYALLRAIENGASIKFILSYRNTEKLKEYYNTSVYYSVRYDIWINDLITRYNAINEVLSDVQTSIIVDHKFIDGDAVRIPDDNEIIDDALAALLAAEELEKSAAMADHESVRYTLQTIRKNLMNCEDKLPAALDVENENSILSLYNTANDLNEALTVSDEAMTAAKTTLDALNAEKAELEAVKDKDSVKERLDELKTELEAATKAYDEAVAAVKSAYDALYDATTKVVDSASELIDLYEFANENFDMLYSNDAFTEEIREELAAIKEALADDYAALKDLFDNDIFAILEDVEAFYAENAEILAEEEVEEEVVIEVEDYEPFNKYAVSENSVVYEEYENGKKIILNFNNYTIKVTVDSVAYTVDAYGYVIIA